VPLAAPSVTTTSVSPSWRSTRAASSARSVSTRTVFVVPACSSASEPWDTRWPSNITPTWLHICSTSASGTLGQVEVAKIVPNLVDDLIPVLGFTVRSPSLEDVFVSLTGEGFDVSG
jgi:hypothetical protein